MWFVEDLRKRLEGIMLWVALIILAILLITANRIKKKILDLNDEDVALFNTYKEMMKSKSVDTHPDNLTEREENIWSLADAERKNEGQRKFWKGVAFFFIAAIFLTVLTITILNVAVR